MIIVMMTTHRYVLCTEALCSQASTAVLNHVGADALRKAHTAAQASMCQILESELNGIRESGMWKNERIIVTSQGPSIRVHDRQNPVLNFCANNYLGLSVSAYCLMFFCEKYKLLLTVTR